MRFLYRMLSIFGSIKTARRGPGPLARRIVRQGAHRSLARGMRKFKWTRR